MGCDIHMYVEHRVNKKWESADEWEPEEGEDGKCERVPYRKQIYTDRCYDLFSILAGVRNGSGFAGVDTGDGFVPIAPPRGLPEDVSAKVARCSENWGVDGHSHSYLTVAELIQYDWTRTTKKRGVINGPAFAKWSEYLRQRGYGPDSYCGDAWGPNIRHISVEAMEAAVTAANHHKTNYGVDKAIKELEHLYCKVEWEVPYYRAASNFLAETLPRLWRLGPPADVRIVFWFDN